MLTTQKFLISTTLLILGLVSAASWSIIANPCPRSMAGAIVDTVNHRMILFGGGNYRLPWGDNFNDVWSLSLEQGYESWQLLTPNGSPPPKRYSMAIAYDNLSNRVLVFGGRAGDVFYNDIWALDLTSGNESWIQLFPTGTPPSPREALTAVFDLINNRMIIFGGLDGSGQPLNETWALNFNTQSWALLSPSGNLPPPRGGHTAIYDPVSHRMIIYGGGGGSQFYSDIWALDLTMGNESWTQIYATGTSPAPRARHFGVYDRITDAFVIGFGFTYAPGFIYFNDVFRLDLTNLVWEQIYPVGVVIEGRRGSCAGYDNINHRVVVFGGDQYYDYYFGDTYSLELDPGAINEKPGNNLEPYISIKPAQNPSRLPYLINVFVPSRTKISLSALDASGRIVSNLIRETEFSGNCIVEWNGLDSNGRRIPAGTYFLYLKTNDSPLIKKAIVIE